MKELTRNKLLAAWQYCDDEDKSTNGWCYMQGWIRKETISSRYSANARTKLE